jgi:hypothetical protein
MKFAANSCLFLVVANLQIRVFLLGAQLAASKLAPRFLLEI